MNQDDDSPPRNRSTTPDRAALSASKRPEDAEWWLTRATQDPEKEDDERQDWVGALGRATPEEEDGVVVVEVSEPPSPGAMRWVALFLCCLLLFGNYYAYDNPSALSVQMHEYLGIPYAQFAYYLNLFYSVYSLPNVPMTLVSGWLMDRFGTHRVLLILSVCVCVGQLVFVLGLEWKNLNVMLAGRILFGIGGESVGVAQASITTSWFRNKELAFALGINLCVARLGSVVNAVLSPRTTLAWGVTTAAWMGFFFCLASLASGVLLVLVIGTPDPAPLVLDSEAVVDERTPLLVRVDVGAVRDAFDAEADSTAAAERELVDAAGKVVADASHLSTSAGTGSSSTAVDAGGSATPTTTSSRSSHRTPALLAAALDTGMFASWRQLPPSFWLLCLVCITLYGTVVPFGAVASEFFQAKWYPGDPATAGLVMSTPDSVSAFLVPIMGVLIDRYGRRCSSMLVCAVLIMGAHSALALAPADAMPPLAAMLPLGAAYSLYGTAMWPSIACLVHDPHLVATAYGIATSALNASLAVVPVVVASLLVAADDPQGGDPVAKYLPVEFFFVGLAAAGLVAAAALYRADKRSGGFLESAALAPPAAITAVAEDAEATVSGILNPPLARRLRSREASYLSTQSLATVASRASSAATAAAPLTPPPLFFHPMIRSASQGSLIAATNAMAAAAAASSVPLTRSLSLYGGTASGLSRLHSRRGTAATAQTQQGMHQPLRRAVTASSASNASSSSRPQQQQQQQQWYRRVRRGETLPLPPSSTAGAPLPDMEQEANGSGPRRWSSRGAPRRYAAVHVHDVFAPAGDAERVVVGSPEEHQQQ
ncbi:hypothetical protein H9P43_006160 [Blastocladiella emersonii ATCC 22665]|nr:hypothetical protein H9P43_006160 [Blastocladiella emersonii ATCC 22665]